MNSNSSDEQTSISYYVSIATSVCLAISELLPYLSKVKGNGILQVLLQSYQQKKQEEEKIQEDLYTKVEDILQRLQRLEQKNNSS